MKATLILAMLLVLPALAFSQTKKSKTPPAPAVATTPAAEKLDTLYHRREQHSVQEVSATEENIVPLFNGYALFFKEGQAIRLRPGDAARMPVFVVRDQLATPAEVEAVASGEVDQVTLLKNKKATAAYGEQARNGVVILRMRKL